MTFKKILIKKNFASCLTFEKSMGLLASLKYRLISLGSVEPRLRALSKHS